VKVDRALVDGRERALVLDEPEHRAGRLLDDGEGVGARRAERHARGRIVTAGPDITGVRALELGQDGRALERLVAEDGAIAVVERRLEGRRPHVAVEYAVVLVVEDRGLHPAAEQRLRLAHEVLVERILARYEHRQAMAAAAGAAPLLAKARDGAWEADRDDTVEQPDVDAQLEGVRGRDAEQLARGQLLLDLPTLRRRVARAVRRQP
jgi:hypothetical protein